MVQLVFRIRIHMDPLCVRKLDPDSDPHQSEKLDPDLNFRQSQKLSRLKMEPWSAVDAQKIADPHYLDGEQEQDPARIRIKVKSWSASALK
jgi:hypothetical protein